ncbi:leucine-rich repeat protein [Hominisplanchenecus sp.]|uniref:leucine-rich repeat protein n=1 Tax=Hominisplanchenecus sp. TaxID=3038130 RepID=UPI00399B2560
MFRQFKNIMLKGIMLFALFCILPIMAANAADNEANPFEGKIYESDYAYFENAVAVNHVVYRYMPETDSVLAECIDLNSTLKKHMTLTIEKSVLGKPVTEIGGYFTDPYYMDAKIGYLFDKIYIPDSVKSINGPSFSECTNVKSIYIPDSVKKIDGQAFEECTSLQSVRLPNGLKEIKYGCFYNCKNLRKIVIPNGVQKIGADAFAGCEKLEIYIPTSVRKIGKYITLTDVKKIYCQKNTVAYKYAKKNKVAVEITGTKRTQQNYVAQKLLLKKNAVTLKPNSSYRVEAEMVPFYASKQELAYSSNKPEIAAVSDEGFVTAKKAGSAVITVKTTDGSKKKVRLKVTVRPEKPVNFIAQKKGKKKAVFSWDPVAGAAGYEVAQADSQKGKYTTICQQKKKTSVELKISKDKYYKVRAWYKKDGELIYGAFSKAIKAS